MAITTSNSIKVNPNRFLMINVLGKKSDDTTTRKPREKGVVISSTMDGKRNHETTKLPGKKPGHRQMEPTALITRAAKNVPAPARPFMPEALKRGSTFLCAWITGSVGRSSLLPFAEFPLVLRWGYIAFHLGSGRLRGLLVDQGCIVLTATRHTQQAKTEQRQARYAGKQPHGKCRTPRRTKCGCTCSSRRSGDTLQPVSPDFHRLIRLKQRKPNLFGSGGKDEGDRVSWALPNLVVVATDWPPCQKTPNSVQMTIS